MNPSAAMVLMIEFLVATLCFARLSLEGAFFGSDWLFRSPLRSAPAF